MAQDCPRKEQSWAFLLELLSCLYGPMCIFFASTRSFEIIRDHLYVHICRFLHRHTIQHETRSFSPTLARSIWDTERGIGMAFADQDKHSGVASITRSLCTSSSSSSSYHGRPDRRERELKDLSAFDFSSSSSTDLDIFSLGAYSRDINAGRFSLLMQPATGRGYVDMSDRSHISLRLDLNSCFLTLIFF